MSEHTPGPWKVDSKYCVGPVSQEDDQSYGMIIPVADVYGPNRKADAELIASAPQLREQNRVLRGLVVYVEQIEADLHAALNGTLHDSSWIRPIQLSRNERQELYLGCLKQLQALKAALTATSQEGQ